MVGACGFCSALEGFWGSASSIVIMVDCGIVLVVVVIVRLQSCCRKGERFQADTSSGCWP